MFGDVTDLRRSSRQLDDVRARLDAELRRAIRLHSVAMDQLAETPLPAALGQFIDVARDITGADSANIQLTDERGVLRIVAHAGFSQPFLDHFGAVDACSDSVCAQAFSARHRVSIDDVTRSELLIGTAALPVLEAAGVRAVQFTPLFNRSGTPVGMLSTHHRTPHVVDESEARWLDLLATRVAFAIERAAFDQATERTHEDLAHLVDERTRDLRDALDGAKAGTWHIDLRANTVTWDERSREMFGSEVHSYPFDPTFSEVHPDDQARLQARFQAMQTPGDDAWDVEFRARRRDGEVVWIQGVGAMDRDAEGRPTFFHGINLDVTERKRAEHSVLESRRHEQEATDALHSLFAAAVEGILTHDSAGVITQANTALHEMFGYAPGELIGRPLEQLLPEALRSAHAQERAVFWAKKRSRRMGDGRNLAGQRKDGTTFPVEVSLTHIETPQPEGRVFAFVTDITERKRVEEERRQNHAALLVQADQLRHRTVQLRRLASDLTLAEHRSREQLAKTLHDGLQQILFSAALRINRLVTSGGVAVDVEPLRRAQDELQQAMEAARSLSIELFPPLLVSGRLDDALVWLAQSMKDKYGLSVDVTAGAHGVVSSKDRRTFIFECVRELLFNVVKHAQVTRASVDVVPDGDDRIRITVADQGAGFDSAAVLSKESSTHGWGLFSMRERTELIGGTMEVESAHGKGTRFTLVVPAGERAVSLPPPLRILIADGHVAARVALREILTKRTEFDIVGEAVTGTEAVERATALRPDVIIMDVSMPQMSGIDATRAILSSLPGTTIFGFSTGELPDGPHEMEMAGADGYFRKGDDPRQMIDRLLALYRGGLARSS